MPAKKGSIDKSFGRKTLEGAEYIGKNFWKVLPIGSLFNYQKNRMPKDPNSIIDIKKEGIKFLGHLGYSMAGIYLLINAMLFGGKYLIGGFAGHGWAPTQIKQYNLNQKIINEMNEEHKNEVNYRFNRIFQDSNAKTFQDSVDIYQKYDLSIILPELTLKQKEEAIKQNELERALK